MIKPGDIKFLERRNLFVKTGQCTARSMSKLIYEFDKKHDLVSFNINNLEIDNVLIKYFERIEAFKLDNDYLDGDFINASKIAGFTMDVFLNHKSFGINLDNFFHVCDRKSRDKWYNFTILLFMYLLSCAILTIEVKKIDANAERDFFLCVFRRRTIHAEWMSWAMFSLQEAYLSTWSIGRVVRWVRKKTRKNTWYNKCIISLFSKN